MNKGLFFYQKLASEYDDMTRFNERLKSEAEVMQNWIGRYPVKNVLDAACGTGLHAIVLAQMGIRVIGTDVSADMLKIARKNADQLGIKISWIESPMQNLKNKLTQNFDGIFCLGNSLPHLLTETDLNSALSSFYNLIEKNGILVIQVLNYTKIVTEKQRIVGINKKDNKEFIRFYDFLDNTIRFNILSVYWMNDNAKFELKSTELYPYQRFQLEEALIRSGFKNLTLYGDMKFSHFKADRSPNLVIVAEK